MSELDCWSCKNKTSFQAISNNDGDCPNCGVEIDMYTVAENLQQQLDEQVVLLSDISNMCIGEIAMSYKLDAQAIGEKIYKVTGMTNPELSKHTDSLRGE